jgi:hypothetical protein
MYCPVYVAVVVFVEVCYGVDDLARFLRGCGVVKVDKGVAVYFAF